MDDEPDRLLPIANVGRLMKQHLPPTARISKEAKQRMQECATEFISFVTGEASNKCRKDHRRIVNGDDICWALSSVGFDDYAKATVRYLHKYREAEEREKANQQKATDGTVDRNKQEEFNHESSPEAQQPNEQTPEPMLEFRFL